MFIVMFSMKGFYVSARGAIQGHHGSLVITYHAVCDHGCIFDRVENKISLLILLV